MIYVEALCSECGAALRVYQNSAGGTGDLYLTVGADGQLGAQALCKNTAMCAERQAAR
jgi:hypothetical protein